MVARRTAALLGLLGGLAMLSVGDATAADKMAADTHHRRARHARHFYPPEAPVVPLGYAYGGYQRAYPPGYGYIVPGQGYDGPGFGFPGY